MSWDGIAAARLSLARVAQQTFAMVGANFVRLYLVSLSVMVVPTALSFWRLQHLAAGGVTPTNIFARFTGPTFWLSVFVGLVASAFLYASLSWEATEQLQGRRPPLGEMLAAGARTTPVLIAVGVLAYFGIVLGTLCLVVPGIFLALAWSLAAPVAAVERRGVFGVFGRSFELTRNNRWMIFLILLAYVIGCLLVALLLGVVMRLVTGMTGSPFVPRTTVGPMVWVSLVFNLLVGALLRVVGATGLGVIYSELRGLRGGFDAQRLSEVFA